MSNWANRSKAEINEVKLTKVGGGGGNPEDRISTYIIYGPPKKDGQRQLKAGDTFQGKYVATFENEVTIKGKKTVLKTHKIKLDNGEIVGLSGSGLVNYQFNLIAPGSTVKVTYNGKDDQGRHQFDTYSDGQ